jgi:hypothetical protein
MVASVYTTPAFQFLFKLASISTWRAHLADGWRAKMLLGWWETGFHYCGNKANNMILLQGSLPQMLVTCMTIRWPTKTIFNHQSGLSNHLTTNHIWDGFVILSLIEDAVVCSRLLRVPHIGSQADRFKLAMEERNNRIILNGQPDAVWHACDRCMRIFLMPDGNFGKNSP